MVTSRVRVEGTWPGPITLRRGWSRAESRPWNDVIPMAHLRLIRGGGPGFLVDCVDALLELGASGVLSPPLPRSAQRSWRDADFHDHADLSLLRKELNRLPPPSHLVHTGDDDDIDEALRIDRAAFTDFWQFDRQAMVEATRATPRSVIQVIRKPDDGLAGFAITGVGTTIGYLQRVAVDTTWQGQGMGRSLVRASARWAKQQGAQALMLNTQRDHPAAMGLYESEGFTTLAEPLVVLSCAG